MDKKIRLEKIQELKNRPEVNNQFKSREECLAWANKVGGKKEKFTKTEEKNRAMIFLNVVMSNSIYKYV